MSADGVLLVNSGVLIEGAKKIRAEGKEEAPLRNGVRVTPSQLEAAARILMEAEPSIITSARGSASFDGSTIGKPQERPGFIRADGHPGRGSVHFEVGILPTTIYRITRKGTATEVRGR